MLTNIKVYAVGIQEKSVITLSCRKTIISLKIKLELNLMVEG